MKTRLVTGALAVLGACLLTIALQRLTVLVGAAENIESARSQASETVAQNAGGLSDVLFDPFDGSFTAAYSIPREIARTGSAAYQWGRVLASSSGFTDTLWSVGGGTGAALDPDVSNYPRNVNTTITYGPLDMAQAVTVTLEFRHWIAVGTGDRLEWGYSTDGSTYTYATVTPGTWEATSLSSDTGSALDPLLGQRRVYLAFRFISDGDNSLDRGAFLDDVRVQATYDVKVYWPIVLRDWFKEYDYLETFDQTDGGWPVGSVYNEGLPQSFEGAYMAEDLSDLNEYGVAIAEEFRYGYKQDKDGSKVYYINVRDNYDHVFLTGPLQVMGNFEYEAWMRRMSEDSDQSYEYGILISPTPINPKKPAADNVYTFQIQLGYGGYWWVKRWDIYGLDDRDADKLGNEKTGDLTETPRVWNQFRIERDGNTLYFKMTHGTTAPKPGDFDTVLTYTPGPGDPPLADTYYVGFFVAHAGISKDLEYQYDNVYVHASPN